MFEREVMPLWHEFLRQGKFLAASLTPVEGGDQGHEGVRDYILHVAAEPPLVWFGTTRFKVEETQPEHDVNQMGGRQAPLTVTHTDPSPMATPVGDFPTPVGRDGWELRMITLVNDPFTASVTQTF
jgi:hypothetical protein